MARALLSEHLGARLLRGTRRAWEWVESVGEDVLVLDHARLERQALRLLHPDPTLPVLFIGAEEAEREVLARQLPHVAFLPDNLLGASANASATTTAEPALLPWGTGAFQAIVAPRLLDASPSRTTWVELARLLREEGHVLLGASRSPDAHARGAARCPAYVEAALVELQACGLWPTLHVGLRRGQWLIDCVRVGRNDAALRRH